MTQKTNPQLENKSRQELQKIKTDALARKKELEAIKPEDLTAEQTQELKEVSAFIPELDALIEKTPADSKENKGTGKAKTPKYVPEPGTEDMVHLLLREGHRFSPTTGKPVNEPYKQLFTFGEWQLLKDNLARLGLTIVQVLYDPYNQAKAFEEKPSK